MKLKMKRTNYYMPKQMHDRVKALSDKTGVPMSEIIRRAIDEHLKLNADPDQSL
jgi:predicted DNA-binding protein